MACTSLKPIPSASFCSAVSGGSFLKLCNFSQVSFISNRLPVIRCRIDLARCKRSGVEVPRRLVPSFVAFAADGETAEAQTEPQEQDTVQGSEYEAENKGNIDVAINVAIDVGASTEIDDTTAEESGSLVTKTLRLYREALANNDESKVAELESFLRSFEDQKNDLERKVAEELSSERDRVLRISADFDNFRKRTERERLLVVTNAQGEVLEKLLPVLDNFERAKAQIKVETEAEEKITNSYQSIYKQLVESLGSIGVLPVETVGKTFDPMLHEAIMREDSTEYEDGVIIEEYRKGYQLGERLLRPSMVKVSSGPGPAKPEIKYQSEDQKDTNETDKEGSSETKSAEE